MNQQKIIITKVLSIFLPILIGTIQSISAQNLCDNLPAGAVKGAFEIEGNITAGCSPLTVKVHDKSGGTDIRYLFQYKDEKANALDMVNHKDSTDVLFSNPTSIRVYTILQYGTKGGKPMYACQNVSVRPNSVPKFTYSQCGSTVEIAVPKSKENFYGYYEITWNNNPSTKIRIDSSQLPFAISKNVTFPANLKVEGFPNALSGCISVNTQTALALNATNYPNGLILPFDPNIDELTMPNKSTAIFKFRGSENPSGYNLNIRENNPNSNFTLFQQGVRPGDVKISIPDSTKSYCFFMNRNICSEYTSEVCTIPQKAIVFNDNTVELEWPSYPDNINKRAVVPRLNTIEKEITIEKKISGVLTETPVSSSETDYKETVNTCINGAQYRIKIKVSGFLQGYRYNSMVFSNWEEIKENTISPNAVTDILTTISPNNEVIINFKDNSNWTLAIQKYFLFDSLNNKIDSIDFPKDAFKNLSGSNAMTQCYRMGFKDICGNNSKYSPEVCPIFLQVDQNDNLNWTVKTPFGLSNIKEFELISMDEITANENIVEKFNSGENKSIPNLDSFEKEAKFKIRAIGASSTESFSNIVIIPIQALFFLPDAFTPNADGINDLLVPKGTFWKDGFLFLKDL